MSSSYPYYIVWTGALHLGDTPGVFMDAQYAGLLVQIPITVTFVSERTDPIVFVVTTTEVEIFDNKKHPIYWDWTPGTPLPTPVGYIDDQDLITGQPEKHLLSIPQNSAAIGKHWITIQVNPETAAGLRDDFVLRRLEAHESIGAKIGW
ncbi:hypothetical protein [Nostoc sp. DedSLP04]|uniref:hypothetical protein n=1 Tax=Nostoc sp. DedSLP04 TaxID=3075401 RepID=UPI002AD53012|nr:hypothetical protein [Nostoc sp. DedSLP04]MDZ8035863.1 hypothetical protein [Nostoc sp. DedSLP04]